MTIEAQFDRIATALEGIGQRIDALGAAIAAMNGGTLAPLALVTTADTVIHNDKGTPAEEVLTAPPAPEPKKRGRPALKAVSTAPEPDAAPVVEETPLAPEATEDAVKTAILAFAGKHGKAAAVAILARHGAARVRDLDPATYGAVLADIAKG